MKQRTRSRELALQFLYQLDVVGAAVLPDLDRFLVELEPNQAVRDFAKRLVVGAWGERRKIDLAIGEVAQNWEISRMAVVDRNVLRLATFELLFCPDIPPKVSINEAIELGKRFSTAQSGGFINGVLDKIKDRAPAADARADQRGADQTPVVEANADTEGGGGDPS